jgi:hypothetical protein
VETGLPELDEGVEDEPPRLPLELELEEPEFDDPELDEPELDDPEFDEPELDDLEFEEPELDEPEFEEPEPEDDVPELVLPDVDELLVVVEPVFPVVWCVEAGRLRATAPAAARLAKLTAAVVALSRYRPRSRSAIARAASRGSGLVMAPIFARVFEELVYVVSQYPMSSRSLLRGGGLKGGRPPRETEFVRRGRARRS